MAIEESEGSIPSVTMAREETDNTMERSKLYQKLFEDTESEIMEVSTPREVVKKPRVKCVREKQTK